MVMRLAVCNFNCAGHDGSVRALERSGGRETEASSTGTHVHTSVHTFSQVHCVKFQITQMNKLYT